MYKLNEMPIWTFASLTICFSNERITICKDVDIEQLNACCVVNGFFKAGASDKEALYKVYLAGPMPKVYNKNKGEKDYRESLIKRMAGSKIQFFLPRAFNLPDNCSNVVYALNDYASIELSDFIIVFVGKRIGLGTAQEMMYAKTVGVPVICVVLENCEHFEWEDLNTGTGKKVYHPFINANSTIIVRGIDDIPLAVEELKNLLGCCGMSEASRKTRIDHFKHLVKNRYPVIDSVFECDK